MPSPFTPPLAGGASFLTYPESLYINGDPGNEATFRPPMERVIEAAEHVHFRIGEVDRVPGGRLDVLTDKLGFAFPVDDVLSGVDWTEAGAYAPTFISTPTDQTLLQALNEVDVGAAAQKSRLDLLVPRVMPGGDLVGPFPPYATPPTLFGVTDDHHLALSKLEVELTATSAVATAAGAASTANATSIQNLEDKLNPGAGTGAADVAGPFTFATTYVVTNSPLKAVIEILDKKIKGLQDFNTGLVHALSFGGGGATQWIAEMSTAQGANSFQAGPSTATLVLSEHRVIGPGTAIFLGPGAGASVRLVWEPRIVGVTVRGNSNNGIGTLSNMPWGVLVNFALDGTGGNHWFEFTLPGANDYINFFIVHPS